MDSKIEPKTKEKSYKSIKNAVGQIRYEFTNQNILELNIHSTNFASVLK